MLAGIWHGCYDDKYKIKDLWFLRQLSRDEVVRKVPAAQPACLGSATSLRVSEPRRAVYCACLSHSVLCTAMQLNKPPPQQLLFNPLSFKGAANVEHSEERRKCAAPICKRGSVGL